MAHNQLDSEPVVLPLPRAHLFDPAPELALLRQRQPVCPLRYPGGEVGWLVTSHDLVTRVLTDSRFSSVDVKSPVGGPGDAPELNNIPALMNAVPELRVGVMGILDPPKHTRLRQLQTSYFTARKVAQHRDGIASIVEDQLDAMEAKGQPADVVTEFARPIPSLILCDLLGVSRDERGRFDRATAAFLDDPEADFEENIRAVRDLLDYVRGVVERKRVEPQDDLLSDFITNAGDLTDDELVGAAWFLFAAGAHSTATMLALSVFALLYEPDRWQALQSADHMELEGAVEELLRYLTIFQVGTMRKASEDVDIDGVRIAAGDNLTVSLASANRDDARFAEPDRFDPLREAVGHLAFGGGRHKCLGQHLARLELQIALAGLLKRFPTLRLAGRAEDTPMHSAALALYGVDELLVSW